MLNMLPFDRRPADLFRAFTGSLDKDFSAIRTDIVEKGDSYLLQAELPGFQKEDIAIDLNGNMLTITAKQDETKEDKTENYVRRERRSGFFTRSFDVSEIDAERITARYNDGILELTLPKAALPASSSQKIAIE